jgi:peroxiredoxin
MNKTTLTPPPLVRALSVVAGVLLGACLLLAAKLYNPPPRVINYQELVGKVIPEIVLQQLEGTPASTHELRGKTHVLALVSPGCEACESIYPALKEVTERVPVLMVSDMREKMQEKAKEKGFAFPILFDSLSVLKDSLDISAIPVTMVIDEQERITKIAIGGGPDFNDMVRPFQGAATPGEEQK